MKAQHLGLVAFLVACSGASAWAVCETADIDAVKTSAGAFKDDPFGKTGLLAKIDCLRKAAAAKQEGAAAALPAYEKELAVRQKVWSWETSDRPPDGNPTVVCDGKGGMRPALFGHGNERVKGYNRCLWLHEQLHIRDFMKTCPNWCKGKTAGTISPYLDGTMPEELQTYMKSLCPAWKNLHDFKMWSFTSECEAYVVQDKCTHDMYLEEKSKPKPDDSVLSGLRYLKKLNGKNHGDKERGAASMKPPATCMEIPDEWPATPAPKIETAVTDPNAVLKYLGAATGSEPLSADDSKAVKKVLPPAPAPGTPPAKGATGTIMKLNGKP